MNTVVSCTAVDLETADAVECSICLIDKSELDFFTLLSCAHQFCRDCLSQFVAVSVNQSNVDIQCPAPGCNSKIHPNDVVLLLTSEVLNRWEIYQIRKALVSDRNVHWCPESTCPYAVITDDCQNCPNLICGFEGCGVEFCSFCGEKRHDGSSCHISSQLLITSDGAVKPCPTCKVGIYKNEGCNFMNCQICGCKFCWICLEESDSLFHYTGRSSCPYYGDRQKPTWQKVGIQILMCILAIPAVPLVAALLGIAAGLLMPYWLAKIYCDLLERKYLRNIGYVSLWILCLPMGLATAPFVTILSFFAGVAIVFVILPLFWFVDLRQFDVAGEKYKKSVKTHGSLE